MSQCLYQRLCQRVLGCYPRCRAAQADGFAYFLLCFPPAAATAILSARPPAAQSLPQHRTAHSQHSSLAMACLTSLLGSISAAALVSWAAYELYKHCTKPNKDQDKRDADQEEGAGDYKLPTLRTRPLKPAVDLEFYTYM